MGIKMAWQSHLYAGPRVDCQALAGLLFGRLKHQLREYVALLWGCGVAYPVMEQNIFLNKFGRPRDTKLS